MITRTTIGLYEDKANFTVQAVLLNSVGQVLSVSRKNNHSDFGLPGGKVETIDDSLEAAISREVYEETGISIDTKSMLMIFSMHRNNHMGFTYLVKDWSGEIMTDENHIVKWTDFQEIINGSFGTWNSLVADSLESMNVKIKR